MTPPDHTRRTERESRPVDPHTSALEAVSDTMPPGRFDIDTCDTNEPTEPDDSLGLADDDSLDLGDGGALGVLRRGMAVSPVL